ncbi:hypothetical protein EP7_000607 [Isosphaeraceae bacterium EP7]
MAATAASLACFRLDHSTQVFVFLPNGFGDRTFNVLTVSILAVQATLPFLVAWSPAVLILSLLPPRPESRRVFRQPGVIACLAATLAMALGSVPYLTHSMILGVQSSASKGYLTSFYLFITFANIVPFAIGGAWSTLVLGGSSRRGRNWIDRLGMVIGIAWIVRTVALYACTVIIVLCQTRFFDAVMYHRW